MPIKIEITIEEKKHMPGVVTVDSAFKAWSHGGTEREIKMHDTIALAFKLICEERGRKSLGLSMVERGKVR